MGIAGPGTHSTSAAAKKNDSKCLFDDFTFVSNINVSSGNWNFYGEAYQQEVCTDDGCVSTSFFCCFFFPLGTNSLAKAEEDYKASDCRFINIKKVQLIYVYSKLMIGKDSGEFWASSIRVDSYEDHMGIVGYFPSSLVSQHVYQEASKTVPTRARNLQKPSWPHNYTRLCNGNLL
ncbi:otoraplin [Sylvia borin]